MTKKRIIFALLAIIILLVTYWTYTHSFIEVTVETDGGGQALTYSFTNQSSGKVAATTTGSTTIKKLVSKSDYEVLVWQNTSNNFSIVKTKGFLGTTKLNVKLKKEKNRSFIGNNPEQCTKYANSTLLSYNCGDYYGNVNIHRPATATTPSYTDKIFNPGAAGVVEGFVKNSGHDSVLIYGSIDEDAPAQHQIYRIGNDYALTDRVILDDINQSKSYLAKDQGDGFIVYDSNFEQVHFYKSAAESPVTTNLAKAKNVELEAQSLNSKNGEYLVLYSSKLTDEGGDLSSEVVITKDNQPTHFDFGKHYTLASFCGTEKICLLSGDRLDAYDVSGTTGKYIYSVSGVAAIASLGQDLLVATKYGVINLNVDEKTGYLSYAFGEYKFNHLSIADGDYILGITNSKGRRVALLVNGESVEDVIDKKIFDLQKVPQVISASIYGNHIYIVANIGEPVYNTETRRRDYDPALMKAAAEKINAEIDRLGIDRSKYTISSNAF